LKKSLDTIVFTSFILVFSGVLAIGGASLLMVQRMMDKTNSIAEESRDVDFINHLHNKAYSLITAIHLRMIHGEDKNPVRTFQLSNEIDHDIDEYLKAEKDSPYPESKEEIRLLTSLRDNLQSLRLASQNTQRPQGLDPMAYILMDKMMDQYIQDVAAEARQINRIHFGIITSKVEKNRQSMSLVIYLYLLFSLTGLVLVYLGYRLHSHYVVKPILALAASTQRLAHGDMDIRVKSDSKTEIGQLYQAFNSMAERLQSHQEDLVTFNRELERKVQARTQELEAANGKLLRLEKMAMLGQIATSVNHEIRTPLNTLSMNLQLIKKALGGCGESHTTTCRARQGNLLDRMALIDSEVLRVSGMLEEFVSYARLKPPEPTELELNKVLGYVAEMLTEKAEQAHVALRLSLIEPSPPLWADKNKLIQVLVNLCVNAIQAMPDGGTLTVATTQREDWVEITVADTGTGITEEDLSKIFLPFFTKKPSGLGFGLAIVQRIIEDHGGKITCQSRIGEGTLFTVQLPLRP